MPPYSSATTANWKPRSRNRSSSESNGIDSGTTGTPVIRLATGTLDRWSRGMDTARLRWTSPRTSSESSPITGKRECPVAPAAAMTESAVSVAFRNRTRVRGVSTSAADLPENEIERASSPAVVPSRVPCSADRITRLVSSCGVRAERSSSCGSIAKMRSTPLAVPLSAQMSGRNSVVDTRAGPTIARAVPIGAAMARFFGTSSPNSMDRKLVMISAVSTAAVVPAPPQPQDANGTSINAASAGCITNPSARVVRLIPTWAPESCVDSERNAISRDAAR